MFGVAAKYRIVLDVSKPKHPADNDANALLDAAKFARGVRKRLEFNQVEFVGRIDVSLDTIQSCEQGKRCPTGAAKALLKVLDKAPKGGRWRP